MIFRVHDPVVLDLFNQLDETLMALVGLQVEVMHQHLHLVEEHILDCLAVGLGLFHKTHGFWDPLFADHGICHLLAELLSLLGGH